MTVIFIISMKISHFQKRSFDVLFYGKENLSVMLQFHITQPLLITSLFLEFIS